MHKIDALIREFPSRGPFHSVPIKLALWLWNNTNCNSYVRCELQHDRKAAIKWGKNVAERRNLFDTIKRAEMHKSQ